MIGIRSRRAKPGATLQPRIKIWLETEGRSGFCLGLCNMLQAVERSGSIKQAAADLGRSYRYVWGRIKAAEELIGRQLVDSQVGGIGPLRSQLTPAAKSVIADFLAIGAKVDKVLHQEFTRRFH